MKTFLNLFVIALLASFQVHAAGFYVSPKGLDDNPGTRSQPFATLERARQAAEKVFQENRDENCTVWLAGGKYEIREPLAFEASGMKNQKGVLTFKAIPGEHPVVSGGFEITGWHKQSDGTWRAKLPKAFKKKPAPRELFVGNRRGIRARFPNEGYLRVKQAGADRRTHFFFAEGDFPIPENTSGTELVFLHDWSITRIPVKEINPAENRLTAVDSVGNKGLAFFNIDNWEPNPRYFLENAREFLDADYEWFYDSKAREIYLILPEAVHPEEMEIVVPVSEALILLKGETNNLVKNIRFEEITFKNCAWQIPEKGYCGVQACHFDPIRERGSWVAVPAAVKAEWAENCVFASCSFENLGGSGVWLGTGCRRCIISDSEFSDISGNGIMIGEGQGREVNGGRWWKTAPEQVALGNMVEGSTVTECGKQLFGAVGIWCGLTAETTIRDNNIFGLPYSGISIGWMWNPTPTPCRENVIEGNHIHHIMQVLSDGGGIYMLGLQPGSKILNNHIHDVSINAGRAESNGMFLDEGTTDVIVANNLIYNIAKSPLRFHRATINLVKENYLFCTDDNPPIRYNSTKEEDIKKVDNHIYSEQDQGVEEALREAVETWNKKH